MTDAKNIAKRQFLEWLVHCRSRNQDSSLRIWKLSQDHRRRMLASTEETKALNRLAAVAFSLWRAVFLTDEVENDYEKLHEDVETFMENLVHSNAVAYTQDRASRNWVFRYYIDNANSRLEDLKIPMADSGVCLLIGLEEPTSDTTAQQWWEINQNALEQALSNFETFLATSTPRS